MASKAPRDALRAPLLNDALDNLTTRFESKGNLDGLIKDSLIANGHFPITLAESGQGACQEG